MQPVESKKFAGEIFHWFVSRSRRDDAIRIKRKLVATGKIRVRIRMYYPGGFVPRYYKVFIRPASGVTLDQARRLAWKVL